MSDSSAPAARDLHRDLVALADRRLPHRMLDARASFRRPAPQPFDVFRDTALTAAHFQLASRGAAAVRPPVHMAAAPAVVLPRARNAAPSVARRNADAPVPAAYSGKTLGGG
jgi:hypothetical protein